MKKENYKRIYPGYKYRIKEKSMMMEKVIFFQNFIWKN